VAYGEYDLRAPNVYIFSPHSTVKTTVQMSLMTAPISVHLVSAEVECERGPHRVDMAIPYENVVQRFPKGVGRGHQGVQKPPLTPLPAEP
jgi:hypothetical protein